jgi:hypothetical protein
VGIDAATTTAYRPAKGRDLGSPRDTILPSIESSEPASAPSYGRVVNVNRFSLPSIDDGRAIFTGGGVQRRVGDIEILDMTDDTRWPQKRRRMDDVNTDISKSYRADTLATNLPFQQCGLDSSSFHSPAEQNLQPDHSRALLASRYQSSQDYGNISASTPTYHENLDFSAGGTFSRSGETLVTRRPLGQLSGVSHFLSRGDFHQTTSSPRRDDCSEPSRLHFASARRATPVDRGIQEYRAFKARERQDRTLLSPSRLERPLSYQNGNGSHAAADHRSEAARHFDEAESLYGQPHQLPSNGFARDFTAVDELMPLAREDQHYLVRERPAERDHPQRRRSASPVGHLRSESSHVPMYSQVPRERDPEVAAEYLPMDWDRETHRRARLEPVLVAPTRR